jgi:hypothetical protein
MGTFTPFLADSLKGFYKDFLSFFVYQGVQAFTTSQAGIKGKKVRKGLYSLYSLYSGLVFRWVIAVVGPPLGGGANLYGPQALDRAPSFPRRTAGG